MLSKQESNFDLLSEDWKKEYQPSIGVKKEWFRELIEPVIEEELNTTLKDLPNGKASGISNIKYEMLKKLRGEAKKALRKFFSLCLDKGTSPPSWKTSTIFPIPKAKDWKCNLINTRPIILLETSRKLLIKILTNRFFTICKNYNILKDSNYADMPEKSTQKLIHVLNNICEEARKKKKE